MSIASLHAASVSARCGPLTAITTDASPISTRPTRWWIAIAVIPPVSGGAFLLSDTPLSLERAVSEVKDDEAGAIATFTGTVRSNSRGRAVLHLEYEAYEGMAEQVMAEIAASLRERYEITGVAIHHRTGRVEIGEASVVIAVSGPHRADSLAACKEAIDTLKESVPLWKKEVYDGGEEWIGRGS